MLGEVYGLSLNPDGTRLASSGSAETRVWALDIDELLSIARERVTRSLTESECETYHFAECPAAQ